MRRESERVREKGKNVSAHIYSEYMCVVCECVLVCVCVCVLSMGKRIYAYLCV